KGTVIAEDANGKMVPFGQIDEVPVFPGCEGETDKRACFQKMIQKHISKNFRYPQKAQELGIQGRVNTMFVIEEDGSIQNLRMRGPDSLLENEVKRIIERLPKMQPGRQGGEAVRVPFSIPISFRLEQSNFQTSDWKVENSNSEPLSARSDKDFPLVMIDGKESSKEKFEKFQNEKVDAIEFVNVIKGEAATKKYGNKGKNGVIEVKTKKVLENNSDDNRKLDVNYQGSVPFSKVDQVPIFPGCENSANPKACFNEKLQKHISKHFNYPKKAQEKGLQGRVSIMFLISEEGEITSIAKRGPDPLLEDEAVRIISKLPKMTPGQHKGKNVAVPYSIPISFKLN
ncbi:MAG: TonB family protein, partial [Maribacter sp.]